MRTVVVTGASGYIGGQTAIFFHDQGWRVIGIDRQHPSTHLDGYFSKFMISGFETKESLHMIEQTVPDAIVHCAGTSLVGPSVKDPAPYYENNFVATKRLVDFLVDKKIKTKFIFSSSAAVYGEPVLTPCSEEDPTLPVSPYGESKLMIEMMCKSYSQAYDFEYTAFRYFNVCGADVQGRHGQEKNATHIIARVLEAICDNKQFTLHGNNYLTFDGTCVRDYVHVNDIARAHFLASKNSTVGVYNLGTGSGYSNQQVIDTAVQVTESDSLNVLVGPIREGDPAMLTCTAKSFEKETGWYPEYDLNSIISTAWKWHTREL